MNQTENSRRKIRPGRLIAACAAIVLVLGAAGGCYAANVGGIQRQVELWIHGELTDAVIEFNGQGEYTMEYTDETGENRSMVGGGVVIDVFGRERPATEEELMEEIRACLNDPEVSYGDDGSVTVTYYGETHDITGLFENGVCHLQLVHDGETLYLSVRYRQGFAYSPRHYPDI